jgi:hypothetical protein
MSKFSLYFVGNAGNPGVYSFFIFLRISKEVSRIS